jgi:PAS domain S-box-containing protein
MTFSTVALAPSPYLRDLFFVVAMGRMQRKGQAESGRGTKRVARSARAARALRSATRRVYRNGVAPDRDDEERSLARFRVALAHSGVVAFEHDTALRYTWIYPTQFYTVEEVLGRTDAELFGAGDATALMDIKREVLGSGEGQKREVHVTRDGRRFDFLLTVEPVRDADGAIVGLTGASTNISEAKRVQGELARALEFRDQMIGVLGHDLRGPLGGVYGWTQAMLTQSIGEAERRAFVRIERSAKRMLEMIETLLDFAESRFRGQLGVRPGEADLGDIARGVVDELLAANPGRVIRLDVAGRARGQWDAARFAQVASNLIGNALKHGAREGVVDVALRVDDGGVVFDVHNDGPPIPKERIPQLFEPFRAEAPRAGSSTQRGIGLGLYIVDQIVRAHGGSIEVTSTRELGTRFSVRLPR